MRFKIGDEWHEVGPDKPIMIEFDDNNEKFAIMRMEQDRTRFAQFPEGWPRENCLEWMNKGARVQVEELQVLKPLEPGWYAVEVSTRKIDTELEP